MRSSPELIKLNETGPIVTSWQPARIPTPDARYPHPDPHHIQQAMLDFADDQTGQMLEQTRTQAAEILRQAHERSVALQAQAQQEGFEKGYAAARSEAAALLSAAQDVLDQTSAWRDQMLAQSEAAVIGLVIEIGRTIFGAGLALEKELLAKTFERALSEARTLGDLRFHLHPEDEVALDPLWSKQQAATIGQRIELIPDQTVQRGGCFIEGQYGTVDARVETQLRTVFETVSEELSRDRGSQG